MKTGDCNCTRCASLCVGRPGIFAPGEATRAAAELGMTLQEFFDKYLTVNWWSDTSDDNYGEVDHLSPAWLVPDMNELFSKVRGMQNAQLSELRSVVRAAFGTVEKYRSLAGRRCSFGDGYTQGPCALLGPNGCRLSFANRPQECREAYACEPRPPAMSLHKKVVDQWRTENSELKALNVPPAPEPWER